MFVNKIALSFPSNIQNKKNIVTGNLLRRQIFETKSKHFESLNIRLPTIFITGGNQGSFVLNKTITKILPILTKNYFVIHQTGNQTFTPSKNYLPFNFNNDIGWILNKAEIIISRAGANTSQEIIALQKKSILIPLKVSQQDEQLKNAKLVKLKMPQQTIIIPEVKLTPKILLKNINQLFNIPNVKQIETKINYSLLKLIKTL